ncbi:hypothetical protein LCM20_09990 [Halobacillus litoralis]|uniref:hypothetical protein n=1 Tax=Halobacillus litoralis TaxID=45668 RepID=UPI001CD2242E|nr:hypothetical protein [Halobacillus litoralis]MCA0970921.1 hypothetical protein [Halobacillus litoralis]
MTKRNKKNDAQQKSYEPKQRAEGEFAQEFGSAQANEQHKQEAKKARKANKNEK